MADTEKITINLGVVDLGFRLFFDQVVKLY